MQQDIPAAAGSPAWVAAKWAEAYYGVSWEWPNVWYWLSIARPYMSAALFARYKRLASSGTGPGDAAYFAKLKADRTTIVADVQASSVERDAPNGLDKAWVLVTFQLEEFGANEPQQGAPYGPVQALQCVVTREKPGTPWRVSSFGSPDAN